MAGGTGTRLYPASRSDRPKQFLALGGASDDSLLRRTVSRVSFADEIYVSTAEAHADAVREEVPEAGVLVEPEPKDTGPALAYAAHRIREQRRGARDGANERRSREQTGDCVLLCVPSDHVVRGDFESAARTAAIAAVETEGLVAFGVEPTRPATGYGYIEPGTAGDSPDDALGDYAEIEQFREKPDATTAGRFVEAGFYWNAGLFAWTPDALLREARDSPLAPLVEALEAGDPERGFREVESVSIDYAVMERTDDAYVVPATFEWDDLGSWDAVERVAETDENGNAILGDGLAIDAADNVLVADEETHVSAVGVEGLVVAAYDDRVLVVPKEDAQRVREVVAELRDSDLF